jgi:hypothetical protein
MAFATQAKENLAGQNRTNVEEELLAQAAPLNGARPSFQIQSSKPRPREPAICAAAAAAAAPLQVGNVRARAEGPNRGGHPTISLATAAGRGVQHLLHWCQPVVARRVGCLASTQWDTFSTRTWIGIRTRAGATCNPPGRRRARPETRHPVGAQTRPWCPPVTTGVPRGA